MYMYLLFLVEFFIFNLHRTDGLVGLGFPLFFPRVFVFTTRYFALLKLTNTSKFNKDLALSLYRNWTDLNIFVRYRSQIPPFSDVPMGKYKLLIVQECRLLLAETREHRCMTT